MEGYIVNLITMNTGTGSDISMTSLLLEATLVVKLVLVILGIMSLTCWRIIYVKYRELKKAKEHTQSFLKDFWGTQQIHDVYSRSKEYEMSPVAQSFKKAYEELLKVKEVRARKNKQADLKAYNHQSDIDNIYRSLKREQGVQMQSLGDHVSLLATVASAAPFVGLFGTVWGIMDAFLKIAQKGDATLTTVAPPIAEALIATAIGLVAAIPAVIGYNAFFNQLKELDLDVDTFSNDFLNIIKRHLS